MLRSQSQTTTGSTFTFAFAGIVIRAVARVCKRVGNRIAVARLGELDERGLKDIGLTPSDVRAAMSLPMWRDPSEHLCQVAGHKRARAPQQSGTTASLGRLRSRDADVRSGAAKVCPV